MGNVCEILCIAVSHFPCISGCWILDKDPDKNVFYRTFVYTLTYIIQYIPNTFKL